MGCGPCGSDTENRDNYVVTAWAVGLWAVGCELWAVDCGLWAVGGGLWAVGRGPWAVGCGLWAVGRVGQIPRIAIITW